MIACLSPCGESGLKYNASTTCARWPGSLPVWGEWIEIPIRTLMWTVRMSLPVWGEWIEMPHHSQIAVLPISSLPMRGEWIEIDHFHQVFLGFLGLSPCGESGLK